MFARQALDCWIDFCLSPGTASRISSKTDGFSGAVANNPTREEIKHRPVDNTPINGDKSDYEVTKLASGELVIKKFIGFDEKSIVVPNVIDGQKVIGIGKDAYKSCVGVENVSISEGIKYIEDGAFSGCKKLKSISLPSSIERVGSKAEQSKYSYLSMDRAYYSATLGGFYNYSPVGAFSETAIETIDLPHRLIYLGKDAFYGCASLKSINMPNSIKEIGERCFCKCTALLSIQLPDYIVNIGDYAFANCNKLNNISLPTNTKTIGRGTFSACSMLTNIRLNEGLVKIDSEAFQDCKALTRIIIPSTVTDLGNNIFAINGWYQPYDRRRNGHATQEKNKSLTIYCYAGSKGLEYARKEEYQIENAAKMNI